MDKYVYYVVMACVFGACKLKDNQNSCGDGDRSSKTASAVKSSTKNLNIQGVVADYTCNNKTFDWLMKSLVTRIAQQVDEIEEMQEEISLLKKNIKEKNKKAEEVSLQMQENEDYLNTEIQYFHQERKQLLNEISELKSQHRLQLIKYKALQARENLQAHDCADIKHYGYHYSGLYTIYTMSKTSPHTPVNVEDMIRTKEVFCDLHTDGGGWLLFQRRQDGSHSFQMKWDEYRTGFGTVAREFWLGNQLLHEITQQREYELRIDMTDMAGHVYTAEYSSFSLDSEMDDYTLHLGKFSGNAGDSLSHHDGHRFSTVDRDNDNSRSGNCAELYGGGGWWYDRCYDSNLNGKYSKESSKDGIIWFHLDHNHKPLKHVEMKIRPVKFKQTTDYINSHADL